MNLWRKWALPALAVLTILWLAAGAGRVWCLDDGLRLLAASGSAVHRITDLGQVVNSLPGAPVMPDALARSTFPLAEPFVHWDGATPRLVFPPLYLGLLWLFLRLGQAGPVLLALATTFLLAWAARRLAMSRGARLEDSTWLAALLASPVLFYLGTSWEVGITTALLLLLVQEEHEPLPERLSFAYGLLPWARPEMLVLWAGAFLLLKGGRRRLMALGGFVAGTLFHRAMTGSWLWLQVLENTKGQGPQLLERLARFWLPETGAWAWGAVMVFVLLGWNRGLPPWARTGTWLIYAAGAASFLVAQLAGAQTLQPDWGLLLTAPLAVAWLAGRSKGALGGKWSKGEILLLASLVLISLASPVAEGFHWGPRLLVPLLSVMGLMWVLEERAGPSRRMALALGMGVQLVGVVLLGLRHAELRRQDEALQHLRAPVLVTGESWLLGDHPQLAQDRLVYLPWGASPSRQLVEALRRRHLSELDLVCRPDHPLPRYLEDSLGLKPLSLPQALQGGSLTRALEWRRYGLNP